MKKKLVAILMLLSMVLLTGCTAQEQPKNVVDVFDYADIREQVEIRNETALTDTQYTPKSLKETDEMARTLYQNESSRYGVILIVEVQTSKNCLRMVDQNGETVKLQKNQIYQDVPSHKISSNSHVETTAIIKEVLFQTDQSSYQADDTVTFGELYFIADDRVPQMKTSEKNVAYKLSDGKNIGWIPTKAGETYVIFGGYWKDTEVFPDVRPHEYGIYCLSDPTKQAGMLKDAATFAEGVAYLKANYDIAKYGLK